jgi:oligoendopeptidase F
MLKERQEVCKDDCWDLNPLYASFKDWESDYQTLVQEEGNPLKKLSSYRHRLHEGALICCECLQLLMSIDRKLSKLYTYAHLKHHEDVAHEEHKKAEGLARLLYFEFQKISSWIEPELLQLPTATLEGFLKEKLLVPYHVYLQKILRLKPHTLSIAEEELLSLASQPLQTSYQVFSAYNNADIVFENIEDKEGEQHPLSQGSYHLYMQSKDRVLRKQAFEGIHRQYQRFENTLSEMLQGQVNAHLFTARSRHYPSCLDAALFPHKIDTKVYHALIETVKARSAIIHDYVSFRKQYFNLEKVHGYDMHISFASDVSLKFTFEEAVEIVIEAVHILGKEYQDTLEKGLKQQRWVDRYENARKRTGAYSSCCYDSYPYILMNYQGTLSDVLTLAHEAGHSMHSFLSNQTQPYQYSQYTIFVAEVASTFNEELVFRSLLKKLQSPKEKIYLINKKMDAIRTTLFRQTLFAEFELKIHTLAEEGVPLTPDVFKSVYKELNQQYYGKDFCSDDLIQYECFRIPHFYSNFYVYQYATGISAAAALVNKVLKEKNPAPYLQFLSSGSSQYSLDLLNRAGVDMMSKEPIEIAIHEFSQLFHELKQCLGKI